MTARQRRSRQELFEELVAEVRASQVAQDMTDQAAADLLGVNRTDLRCMDVLDQRGRMTAGELAEASGLTTGNVTAMLDRMERAGYATRVRDSEDRRRVYVELTPDAREVGREIYAPLAEGGEKLAKRYSEHELELLLEFTRFGREANEKLAAQLRERLEAGERRSA